MDCYKLLVIEDEPDVLKSITSYFRDCGHQVFEAENGREGLELFRRESPDIVFTDLRMPVMDGFEVISALAESHPETPVIVISGTGVVQDAINAIRLGARDYVVKPIIEMEELNIICKRALHERSLQREVASLKDQLLAGTLRNADAFAGITTQCPAVVAVLKYLDVVAASTQPILVTGETGTGKEIVAQAIHKASGRKGRFVAVNIAGLDDQALSDTLFGHTLGAFTDARQIRDGLIVKAAGGTLFLDEIGDLSLQSQIKLLRLLQEGEYYSLGSDFPRRTDAGIVLATNRDLKTMVDAGTFRQDLYYRLSAHQVRLPSLFERSVDIPLLLEEFLAEAAKSMGRKKPVCPPELSSYLMAYRFPGNIRELRAMVFDAVARHSKGVLSMGTFLGAMASNYCNTPDESDAEIVVIRSKTGERVPALKEAEELLIANALKRARGNQRLAAGYLGISRNALNKKMLRAKSRSN